MTVRRLVAPLVLGLLFLAAPAQAALFTLDSYTTTFNMNDPGLVLWQQNLLGTPTSFNLNTVGQSFTTDLFRLGTNETNLNLDDLKPHALNVNFKFSTPPPGFGGNLQGVSGGFWFKKGFGYAIWNNPLVLSFGNGGYLGISLTNATFGLPGSAVIQATFTLLQQSVTPPPPPPPTQVPESSALLVMFTGLALCIAPGRNRKGR
jgi:hypothetical protein